MIPEIVSTLNMQVEELLRIVSDLDDSHMVLQPLKDMNHITWNVGHLVYGFQAIGDELGIPRWLTPEWIELFREGSALQPDKDRYPDKETLIRALQDGKDRIVQKLESMSPEDISVQLPDERYRHLFPTLGHALVYALIGHLSIHIGYIMALRKLITHSSNNPNDHTDSGKG